MVLETELFCPWLAGIGTIQFDGKGIVLMSQPDVLLWKGDFYPGFVETPEDFPRNLTLGLLGFIHVEKP